MRKVSDSMGPVSVPDDALYGAQTQRAIDNFAISGLRFPRGFIDTLALIKKCAARVNCSLGLLPADIAEAIEKAADQVLEGRHGDQFPIDIFQTGSGTSTNMNINEVIAGICSRDLAVDVHPNDHVNLGQSSNDVIPTAIQVSSVMSIRQHLIPAVSNLIESIDQKAAELQREVKTGRTHLMDAMPLTFGQELSGWSAQLQNALENLDSFLPAFSRLAQGGTAIGTGINTHEEFASRFAREISQQSGISFSRSDNLFKSIGSQDLSVALSGHLKVLAVALYKISTDLRWMNSGPLSGMSDIALQALQPGSSIMPGKVNPVIPEAVSMACAQVVGNDATVSMAGLSSNFQLNVMLPVIAYNLLQSIELLQNSSSHLAERAVGSFTINADNIARSLAVNPILVTALNPIIGYEAAAKIAKKSYQTGRPILEVAMEETDMTEQELGELLDPLKLTNLDR